MRRDSRALLRRGIVIIDVLLGLTLLVIAGVAWITLMGQTSHSIEQLRGRERELARASAVLDEIAGTWSADDFIVRLGTTRHGDFSIVTDELAPNLYEVTIRHAALGTELLRTDFYVGPAQ